MQSTNEFTLKSLGIAMAVGVVMGFALAQGAGEASAGASAAPVVTQASAEIGANAAAPDHATPEANADRSIYDHFHRY